MTTANDDQFMDICEFILTNKLLADNKIIEKIQDEFDIDKELAYKYFDSFMTYMTFGAPDFNARF